MTARAVDVESGVLPTVRRLARSALCATRMRVTLPRSVSLAELASQCEGGDVSEEAIWRALDEQRDEWRTFWKRAAAAAFGLLAIIAGASWTAAGGYWQVQRQLDAVVAVNDAQQATLDSRSAVIARAADERARSERVEDLVEWLVVATQKLADDANVRLEPLPTGIRARRDRAARTSREGS